MKNWIIALVFVGAMSTVSACMQQGSLSIDDVSDKETTNTNDDGDHEAFLEADERYQRYSETRVAPVTSDPTPTGPTGDSGTREDAEEEEEETPSPSSSDWPAFGPETPSAAAVEEDSRVVRTESRGSVAGVRLGVAGVRGFNKDTQARFTKGIGHHSSYHGNTVNLERSRINSLYSEPARYLNRSQRKGYLAQFCNVEQGGDFLSEKCRIESRNYIRFHLYWAKNKLEALVNANPNQLYSFREGNILDSGTPRKWNWDYARMHLLIITDKEWDLYWPKNLKETGKNVGSFCTINPAVGDHDDKGRFTGRQCQQLYPPGNTQTVHLGPCNMCGKE